MSALGISLLNEDSHTPNISKSYVAWNVSINGVLAKSLAGILSRFQTAKDKLVFFGLEGPGLTSTVPEITRRICRTIIKNRAFFILLGNTLSSEKEHLARYEILFGMVLISKNIWTEYNNILSDRWHEWIGKKWSSPRYTVKKNGKQGHYHGTIAKK